MSQRNEGREWKGIDWGWRAVLDTSGQSGRSDYLATQQCYAASPCTAEGHTHIALLFIRSPCGPQGGLICSLGLKHLLSLYTSRGSLLNLAQSPGTVFAMLEIDEGKENLPQDTPNSIKINSLKY